MNEPIHPSSGVSPNPEQSSPRDLVASTLPANRRRASDFDPIPGVDYLVDHYAILGCERDAAAEAITKAYRAKLLEWHPDKIANAPEALRSQATEKVKLLTEAHDVLSQPERRADFDRLLNSFDPELISSTGTPIINLSARRVQVERLISGNEIDLQSMRDRAQLLSGHSDKMFEVIRKGFAITPTDPEIKAAYREALEKKLVYFSVLEDLGWEEAGVSNQSTPTIVPDTEVYIEKRKEQVEEAKSEIEVLVNLKVLQLAQGGTPLLLTAGGTQIVPDDLAGREEEVRQKLQSSAQASFDKHIGKLLDLARERAAVIDQILENFSDYSYLVPVAKGRENLVVLLDQAGSVNGALQYTRSPEGLSMRAVVVPEITNDSEATLDARTKALQESFIDCSVVVLKINPEIDLLMQACHVANKHMELVEKAQ